MKAIASPVRSSSSSKQASCTSSSPQQVVMRAVAAGDDAPGVAEDNRGLGASAQRGAQQRLLGGERPHSCGCARAGRQRRRARVAPLHRTGLRRAHGGGVAHSIDGEGTVCADVVPPTAAGPAGGGCPPQVLAPNGDRRCRGADLPRCEGALAGGVDDLPLRVLRQAPRRGAVLRNERSCARLRREELDRSQGKGAVQPVRDDADAGVGAVEEGLLPELEGAPRLQQVDALNEQLRLCLRPRKAGCVDAAAASQEVPVIREQRSGRRALRQ